MSSVGEKVFDQIYFGVTSVVSKHENIPQVQVRYYLLTEAEDNPIEPGMRMALNLVLASVVKTLEDAPPKLELDALTEDRLHQIAADRFTHAAYNFYQPPFGSYEFGRLDASDGLFVDR